MPNAGQVEEYLTTVDFPAQRDDIVACAVDEGAPEGVVQVLRGMPPVDYANRDEVLRSAHTEP